MDNIKDIGFILHADKYLRDLGILTNVHYNNIILYCKNIHPRVKKVILDVYLVDKTIQITLKIKFWFFPKSKVRSVLIRAIKEYLPDYAFKVRYRY